MVHFASVHYVHMFSVQLCSGGCANYVPGVVPGSSQLSILELLEEEKEKKMKNSDLLPTSRVSTGTLEKQGENISEMAIISKKILFCP